MTRNEFLAQLAEELEDIAPVERAEALQYYNEYLDEAGPESEAGVIAELGGPKKVAAIIRANTPGVMGQRNAQPSAAQSRASADAKAAEKPQPHLTLDGPKYPRPEVAEPDDEKSAQAIHQIVRDYSQPITDTQQQQRARNNRVLLIVILVITSPVWIGLLGTVFGILGGLIGTLAGLVGAGISIVVSSVVAGFFALPLLSTALADGLATLGACMLLAALGLVLSAGCIAAIAKVIEALVRGVTSGFRWLRGKVGF